jgi:copper transport protein
MSEMGTRMDLQRLRAGARRQIPFVAILAGALVLLLAQPADAHALLKTSDPPAGANLSTSPSQVVLTFTEPPDPGLSSITLVNSSGQTVKEGAAEPVPGHTTELRVPITTPLPNGVYTVSWRTVSRTDGHVAAGSFAFGIGTAPPAGAGATSGGVSSTPSPSVLAVVGRWLFYWGLALLVGAAAVGLFVARRRVGRPWMLWAAWAASAAGLVAMILAERSVVGISLARLLSSSTGTEFLDRGAALVVLAVAIAIASVKPEGQPALLGVGVLALGALLVHAVEGHAGAPSTWRLGNITDEWLHLVAVGVWVGGLLWLLMATRQGAQGGAPTGTVTSGAGSTDSSGAIQTQNPSGPIARGSDPGGDEVGGPQPSRDVTGVGTIEDPGAEGLLATGEEPSRTQRATIIHRFSRLATLALAVTVATGILRALSEVGSLHALVSTSFGVTLLIKAGLVAVLVGLGAHNHFRRVPRAHEEKQVGLLRRTVKGEVAVGAAILLVAAILSQLPPASKVSATGQQGPSPLVVTGHDFATTIKLRLSISPGTVGPNTFTAEVTDYDTRAPFAAKDVQLQFRLPSRPDIGASTLDLAHVSGATWRAKGSMLSIFGTYSVQATVQSATSAVTVPLNVRPKLPPQQVAVNRVPGQPTLYTISLAGGGSLQAYADPETAGPNSVHFTFFEASGSEMSIAKARASMVPPGGAAEPMKLIRFDKGHFAANVTLSAGTWIFQIAAATSTGANVRGYFSASIPGG